MQAKKSDLAVKSFFPVIHDISQNAMSRKILIFRKWGSFRNACFWIYNRYLLWAGLARPDPVRFYSVRSSRSLTVFFFSERRKDMSLKILLGTNTGFKNVVPNIEEGEKSRVELTAFLKRWFFAIFRTFSRITWEALNTAAIRIPVTLIDIKK